MDMAAWGWNWEGCLSDFDYFGYHDSWRTLPSYLGVSRNSLPFAISDSSYLVQCTRPRARLYTLTEETRATRERRARHVIWC